MSFTIFLYNYVLYRNSLNNSLYKYGITKLSQTWIKGNGMLRYRDLTDWQKKEIVNGCGGKGGWLRPPDFLFKASCNQHDFYYWRGGNSSDKKTADKAFYKFMKKDCDDAKWYNRVLHYKTAWTYYMAVKLFGKSYFGFGDMKTAEDLPQLFK